MRFSFVGPARSDPLDRVVASVEPNALFPAAICGCCVSGHSCEEHEWVRCARNALARRAKSPCGDAISALHSQFIIFVTRAGQKTAALKEVREGLNNVDVVALS
jgi:phage terminase large subunit-like protein